MVMRVLCVSFLLFVVLSVASAADLKVKVVDPQSAAVAGAQVFLFSKGSDTPLKIATTSAEGIALFSELKFGELKRDELKPGELSSGPYKLQVLAPGFAAFSEDVYDRSGVITIPLRLATTSETVVVTATRTPLAAEETGASISTLEHGQLETLRPVAADDAIRFLPGAVVNTSGQRGGLSSLFVRGGNSNYNKVIVDGVSVTEPGGAIDLGTLPLAEASRLEFLRGAQSTLYGSDALTSVVQVWTRTGSTPVPELRFGADAGNYGTETGYASLAGSHGRFD
jgi:vitamin B12 transporter